MNALTISVACPASVAARFTPYPRLAFPKSFSAVRKTPSLSPLGPLKASSEDHPTGGCPSPSEGKGKLIVDTEHRKVEPGVKILRFRGISIRLKFTRTRLILALLLALVIFMW